MILIINRSVRASIRYLIFQEKQKLYASKVLEELDKSSGFMESKTDNKEIKCEPIKPKFSLEKVKSEIKKIKENFKNLNIKIYIAPTNECIYKKNIYTKLYKGIIDNNLYFLEDDYFNDFSHLNLKGAIKNSAIFSDWLLKK